MLRQKVLIIICLIYFFLLPYSYLRFTMTLRENFVISFGFLFIYLLVKYKDLLANPDIGKIILLSLLYAYIALAHNLVFLVVSLVFLFLFLEQLFRKRNVLSFIIIVVLTAVIALPGFIKFYAGLIYQVQLGVKGSPITFPANYNLIDLSYFNPFTNKIFGRNILFSFTTHLLSLFGYFWHILTSCL